VVLHAINKAWGLLYHPWLQWRAVCFEAGDDDVGADVPIAMAHKVISLQATLLHSGTIHS
jgi:hypothetical protein